MDCGDITDSQDGQKSKNDTNKSTSNENSNIVFEFDDDYGYENYEPAARSAFEQKVKSGEIIRSTKHTNKTVAVLRYKNRQARRAKNQEIVEKIVFILGVVGCMTCNTIEVGSAFNFFAHDFDIILARKRIQIKYKLTDEKEIRRLTTLHRKRAGSSLTAHLRICNPSAVVSKPPDEKPLNQSGTKNSGQLKNKATHILQTKTAAAMMCITGGVPMSFLENPYLPSFCDLTGSLRSVYFFIFSRFSVG